MRASADGGSVVVPTAASAASAAAAAAAASHSVQLTHNPLDVAVLQLLHSCTGGNPSQRFFHVLWSGAPALLTVISFTARPHALSVPPSGARPGAGGGTGPAAALLASALDAPPPPQPNMLPQPDVLAIAAEVEAQLLMLMHAPANGQPPILAVARIGTRAHVCSPGDEELTQRTACEVHIIMPPDAGEAESLEAWLRQRWAAPLGPPASVGGAGAGAGGASTAAGDPAPLPPRLVPISLGAAAPGASGAPKPPARDGGMGGATALPAGVATAARAVAQPGTVLGISGRTTLPACASASTSEEQPQTAGEGADALAPVPPSPPSATATADDQQSPFLFSPHAEHSPSFGVISACTPESPRACSTDCGRSAYSSSDTNPSSSAHRTGPSSLRYPQHSMLPTSASGIMSAAARTSSSSAVLAAGSDAPRGPPANGAVSVIDEEACSQALARARAALLRVRTDHGLEAAQQQQQSVPDEPGVAAGGSAEPPPPQQQPGGGTPPLSNMHVAPLGAAARGRGGGPALQPDIVLLPQGQAASQPATTRPGSTGSWLLPPGAAAGRAVRGASSLDGTGAPSSPLDAAASQPGARAPAAAVLLPVPPQPTPPARDAAPTSQPATAAAAAPPAQYRPSRSPTPSLWPVLGILPDPPLPLPRPVFPLASALDILVSLAEGLWGLHQQGIAHGALGLSSLRVMVPAAPQQAPHGPWRAGSITHTELQRRRQTGGGDTRPDGSAGAGGATLRVLLPPVGVGPAVMLLQGWCRPNSRGLPRDHLMYGAPEVLRTSSSQSTSPASPTPTPARFGPGWQQPAPASAPPQLQQSAIAPPGDVYALGVLMWHLVSGQAPFQHLTTHQVRWGMRMAWGRGWEACYGRDRTPHACLPTTPT